ncbi:MAG: hypothetical protein FJX25_18065 [Alphaproteobacteria bacterium]|nr:hypothetical protein [Alphaproteobacteria bacterium]
MKFMDRLSRLLGRHPDSLKTEADRPQHQSKHTAASDIEIHAADNAPSGQKGASGSSDENAVQPQPPNLVAPHDAPDSGKIMSSGGVSPIDLGHAGSITSQYHPVVTNNPRSADNPRCLRASSEANMEMLEP